MNIDDIGRELVKCDLKCNLVNNNPDEGIIPRCILPEERNGKLKSIVVGYNPGKCKAKEREYYLKNDLTYDSVKSHFVESNLKNAPYFKRTRELITVLGYDGDILWTDLAKCECKEENGVLPVQTLRVCINKFLRREIEVFDAHIIFALGNTAFEFCALSFPNHFVIGLPHPSGSYGNFHNIKKKVFENPDHYKKELSEQKDQHGNYQAIQLSKI